MERFCICNADLRSGAYLEFQFHARDGCIDLRYFLGIDVQIQQKSCTTGYIACSMGCGGFHSVPDNVKTGERKQNIK